MLDLHRTIRCCCSRLVCVMALAAWVGGYVASRRAPMADEAREDFNVVQTATLTLLGPHHRLHVLDGGQPLRPAQESRGGGGQCDRHGVSSRRLVGRAPRGASYATLLQAIHHRARPLLHDARRRRARRDRRAHGKSAERTVGGRPRRRRWRIPSPLTRSPSRASTTSINSQGYTQAAWWNRIPRAALAADGADRRCAPTSWSGLGREAAGQRPMRLAVAVPAHPSRSRSSSSRTSMRRAGGVIRVAPQNLHALVDVAALVAEVLVLQREVGHRLLDERDRALAGRRASRPTRARRRPGWKPAP